jgi:HK97 family phage portal protein
MLEGLRSGFADGLRGIAARVSREPDHPGSSRIGYSGRTSAGVLITPENCITISAVWACLRYLSQTVAVLPWHVRKPVEDGSEEAPSHPIDYLINKRPNPEWSSFQFRETLLHWALRRGNGYAEIEPDNFGRPYALWPVHPERVDPCISDGAGVDAYGHAIRDGELFYEVSNGVGEKTILSQSRMYHLRGFGDAPVGVNVVAYAAESLGWAKATQIFGSTFFGNGMNLSGVVINKKPLKPDGLARQKKEFADLYKGPRNANKTAFLDNDADFKTIGTNPKDAQLTDQNMFQVEEICRWFGVPPHKVMHLHRSTFSNIEHQAIEVVVDSVSPWVKRFEDEADWKLFGAQNRQKFYTKMNMRALLRGDFKSQQEGLHIMRLAGALNANEWRELVDMNGGIPGGEKYVMQSQNVPLTMLGQEPPKPTTQPSEPSNDDDEDPEEIAAMTRLEIEASRVEA